MHLPGGDHSRGPRKPLKGKGGRGGRGRTAGTRVGAAPRTAVPVLRGSRWRPGRAFSGAAATSWHPNHGPTCSFRVLFLRHLGAEPVAWEIPITNPAGRASGTWRRKPLDALWFSRHPLPQEPRPAFFGPRGIIY